MANYKVVFLGEEQDEVFSSYEEAEQSAWELCSDYHIGGEIHQTSNPAHYP